MSLKTILLSSIVALGSLGMQAMAETIPETASLRQDELPPLQNAKLALNKDNIKVWTFKGTTSSALNYRASTILSTTLSKAAAVVMDVAYLPNWVPYVNAVDVIEMDQKAGTFILRMEFDFPFPLSNRDVVVEGKMTVRLDSISVNSHAITDVRAPVREHLIRITEYEGSWLLQKTNDQSVKVTTQGFANPAGGLPLAVVNMFVETQPFLMLQNMRLQVKQPRYKNF